MNWDIVIFLSRIAFFLLSTDLVKVPVLAKRSAWLRALVLLAFFVLLQLMLHSSELPPDFTLMFAPSV